MSASVNIPPGTAATLPEQLTDDSVTRFGPSLRRAARKHVGPEFYVDAHAVRAVSTRGVGLLVAMSRLTAIRGSRVVLVNPSPALTDRLISLGLHQRFSRSLTEPASSTASRSR